MQAVAEMIVAEAERYKVTNGRIVSFQSRNRHRKERKDSAVSQSDPREERRNSSPSDSMSKSFEYDSQMPTRPESTMSHYDDDINLLERIAFGNESRPEYTDKEETSGNLQRPNSSSSTSSSSSSVIKISVPNISETKRVVPSPPASASSRKSSTFRTTTHSLSTVSAPESYSRTSKFRKNRLTEATNECRILESSQLKTG
ncbi:hypothetical protein BKA69DRAFT_808712 [Paraphysoderma sedebokerense]|nr:hypothetical protein BKA69DRAFT_808712 [Paraphysoderma sedebokerense]